MKFIGTALLLTILQLSLAGQTGPGIGIYPTGTETGLGFRLSKDKRFTFESRITKASFFSEPAASNFISEASVLCRVILLEKVRFHIGLGVRGDWNSSSPNKLGTVVPVGVEAFPFPFQNAGLFFEAAPFFVADPDYRWHAGIRTVAGFVFYFPTRTNKKNE
jgi:hypothetical protein